jgi:hypothetical protein
MARQAPVHARGFRSGGICPRSADDPKPTSEAWILCALKRNPYRGCEALEKRSANPRSPRALKKELAGILGEADVREALCAMVRNKTIDFDRIKMMSFDSFRERLEEVL